MTQYIFIFPAHVDMGGGELYLSPKTQYSILKLRIGKTLN